MNDRPYIPRLAPNVLNIDEARAWREFHAAVKAVEALAEPNREKPQEEERE